MDIKPIGSGTSALAMCEYITNYITKLALDSGKIMSLIKAAIEKTDSVDCGSQDDRAQLMIKRILNGMIGKRPLSAQQVLHALRDRPDRYTNFSFTTVYWRNILTSACPGVPEFQWKAHGDASDLIILNDEVLMHGVPQVDKVTLYHDYLFRGDEYVDVCFYEYAGSIIKKRLNSNPGSYSQFAPGHPQYETHVQCRRAKWTLPVLKGPRFPPKDESIGYAAAVLCLFKPWASPTAFPADIDWCECLKQFLATMDLRLLRLIQNFEQMYNCKDAADDFAQKRKERLREVLKSVPDLQAVDQEDILETAFSKAMEDDDCHDEPDPIDVIDERTASAMIHTTRAGFYRGERLSSDKQNLIAMQQCLADVDHAAFAETILKRIRKDRDNWVNANRLTESQTGDNLNYVPSFSAPYLTNYKKELDLHNLSMSTHNRYGNLPAPRLLMIALIKKYNLNLEQRLAFLTICDNDYRKSRGGANQLRLVVYGPGGTGKSLIFTAVQEYFRQLRRPGAQKLTAPTGVAACNIGGSTIHTEAKLMTSRAKLRSPVEASRTELEDRWSSTKTLVLDEISFLNCRDLSSVNENTKLAKGMGDADDPKDSSFGGLDVVLLGDFMQLPPVTGSPIYTSKYGDRSAANGLNANALQELSGIECWRSMDTVIQLKRVMRQTDQRYIEMLSRLRFGCCTEDDYEYLQSFVLAPGSESRVEVSMWWSDPANASPLISYTNKVRDAHKDRCAKAYAEMSGVTESYIYYSRDTRGKKGAQITLKGRAAAAAWDVPIKHAHDLAGKLPLLPGMPVICTENIATELGLANGSPGTVLDIRYRISGGRRELVSCLVDIPSWANPAGKTGPEATQVRLAPIAKAIKFNLDSEGPDISATRHQIPLLPAFAFTVHNSQGRSLNAACVDLASAEGVPDACSLAYVMLSRIRDPRRLTILRPFNKKVIQTHATSAVRTEMRRLDARAASTLATADERFAWYLDAEEGRGTFQNQE